MNTEDWEVKKHLLMLIAYQFANLVMLIGLFFALFLLANHLGLLT